MVVTLRSLHQLLSEETFPSSSLSHSFIVNYCPANIFCKQIYVCSTPWPFRQRLLWFVGKGNTSRRYITGIKGHSCAGSTRNTGKTGICLGQLTARGNKIITALLLILLVLGPWKVLLVFAAGREVHGAAVLLQQGMVSMLPITTQAPGATNPAPYSSPYSFIALSTTFCPGTWHSSKFCLSGSASPKLERSWAGAAFGHLFRTCLTDNNASTNLISKRKPTAAKIFWFLGQNCMEDPI